VRQCELQEYIVVAAFGSFAAGPDWRVLGWRADIAPCCESRHQTAMRSNGFQKHLFYGTVLVLLFMGTLSSVFRADVEAKMVSTACASILFLIAIMQYVQRHRSLP
jgi:hypothetical protein